VSTLTTKKISASRAWLINPIIYLEGIKGMSVRIGINPLTWTNDDMPDLGAETSLEQCLSEGKQAGYAGFELGQKFPRKLETLKPIMAKHQLELISGWHSARLLERSVDEEIEALQSHLTLLKGMACKVMVFAEVTECIHGDIEKPLSMRPKLSQGHWVEFGKKMTLVAQYLQKQGVRLAYHHHMGTVVETAEEIDLLMGHTGDAVGLLVDTGHLRYAGADPVELINRYGHRIVHVHCKDVRSLTLNWALENNVSFLTAVLEGVFTVPGDGSVDFGSVFGALKAVDYSGWLVVEAEQDPSKAIPLAYAILGYKYLEKTVAQVGL
jgi:inosose dehydratase